MNLTIISSLVAAAIGFGAAWQIQHWRATEDENHRITQQRESERELYALEQRRRTQVINAANAARKRESKLRVDAAAAQSAVVSLRDTLHGYVQRASSDPATCPDRTAAVSELLVVCGQELTTLAGKCDRHVSDLQTVMQSWPK